MLKAIQSKVTAHSPLLKDTINEIKKVIVGQEYLLNRLMIGLLANGHLLLEGVPGLAKTMSVKTLSDVVHGDFKRIQFTPDLLPADLIGTKIYDQKKSEFTVKKGPIFTNFVLADEINRAPAKVQSALLEAMQEKQVTIGEETFKLPKPFFVLATENPIEQEGTYPLPEAQVDRFLMKLKIDYPSRDEEIEIVNRITGDTNFNLSKVIKAKDILDLQQITKEVYIDEKIIHYIIDIVMATRDPKEYNIPDLDNLIAYGGSPRASIYLTTTAKANAFLNGRAYVMPEDVKEIGRDVLRHRIIPTYEAEAEEITSEQIIDKVFDSIKVP